MVSVSSKKKVRRRMVYQSTDEDEDDKGDSDNDSADETYSINDNEFNNRNDRALGKRMQHDYVTNARLDIGRNIRIQQVEEVDENSDEGDDDNEDDGNGNGHGNGNGDGIKNIEERQSTRTLEERKKRVEKLLEKTDSMVNKLSSMMDAVKKNATAFNNDGESTKVESDDVEDVKKIEKNLNNHSMNTDLSNENSSSSSFSSFSPTSRQIHTPKQPRFVTGGVHVTIN